MGLPVVVNGRCLRRPATGVERYAREVTKRLGSRIRLFRPESPSRGIAGHLWEQMYLPRLVNGDLLWSPANTGPLAVAHQVVTVHDLSPLEHPEWFRPQFAAWYRYLLPRLARRARCLLTDSAFSRDRIVEVLQVPARRVEVVSLGVDGAFSPRPEAERAMVRAKHGLVAPYCLTVGSLQPRKNLLRLADVWRRLRARWPHVDLVIVGRGGRPFRSHGWHAPRDGVRILRAVTDEDLPALYSDALCFVLPSLYEGFGLTVLEAMACGTPVALSSAASLPEVGGDAAVYFDPLDERAMERAVGALLESPDLRAELRERGSSRSARFDWDRTAETTWQVLAQAG